MMPDFPVSESFVKTANAAQLHDEAKGTKRNWPASFTFVNGRWVYRVERDDIDFTAVTTAISNHRPDPEYGFTPERKRLRALRAKATWTPEEIQEVVRILAGWQA